MRTAFWWGNLRERGYVGRPRRRWEDNIKTYFPEVALGAWTGLISFRIETDGRLL